MSKQKPITEIKTSGMIKYLQAMNEKIEIAKIHVRNGAVKSADSQLKFAENLAEMFCQINQDRDIKFI